MLLITKKISALYINIIYDKMKIARLFLKNKINVNLILKKASLLHYAIKTRLFKCELLFIHFLLKHEANVLIKN